MRLQHFSDFGAPGMTGFTGLQSDQHRAFVVLNS
jgi:hypothetical protein